MTDDRETSLVIDHSAGVFHITSNRVSLARHLSELAKAHRLSLEESFGHITLSNVPTQYLSKLQIATHCRNQGKQQSD